ESIGVWRSGCLSILVRRRSAPIHSASCRSGIRTDRGYRTRGRAMSESNWYVAVQGRQEGPFPASEIVARIRAGGIDRQAHVFGPGMAAWAPIGGVPEFASAFAG